MDAGIVCKFIWPESIINMELMMQPYAKQSMSDLSICHRRMSIYLALLMRQVYLYT
jgi:hypothetical protein